MPEMEQNELEQLEMQCFQIVAQVGSARSCFLEAVDKAEQGDFEGAQQLLDEGDKQFCAGHETHRSLLQVEAEGRSLPFRIIILHAEDQLMSAETLRIVAVKLIAVYRKTAQLGKES